MADHEALHILSNPGFTEKSKFFTDSNYLVATEPLGEKAKKSLVGLYKGTDYEQEVRAFCEASQLLLSADEKRTLHTFMQRTRGELFFSKGWLLVEGQSDYIILSYFAEVLEYPFDQMGISLIDFQNNGSVELFIKVAKALSFPWMIITDYDDQKGKTMASLQKCGYTEELMGELVFDTSPYADLETLLVSEGFANIYEEILDSKKVQAVSTTRGTTEYNLQIAALVKEDKIINAYKLVDQLRKMGMTREKVPQKYRDLIERCVKISK